MRLFDSYTHLVDLLRHLRNPACVVDPRGNVDFWNGSAESHFGYSMTEISGQSVTQLLVPEPRVRRAPARGPGAFAVGISTRDAVIRSKAGTPIPVRVRVYRMKGPLDEAAWRLAVAVEQGSPAIEPKRPARALDELHHQVSNHLQGIIGWLRAQADARGPGVEPAAVDAAVAQLLSVAALVHAIAASRQSPADARPPVRHRE